MSAFNPKTIAQVFAEKLTHPGGGEFDDANITTSCTTCQREFTLSELDLRHAGDPRVFSEYHCPSCDSVLAAVSHAATFPADANARYRLGEYAIESASGLNIGGLG